jgi:hypothetical protein
MFCMFAGACSPRQRTPVRHSYKSEIRRPRAYISYMAAAGVALDASHSLTADADMWDILV